MNNSNSKQNNFKLSWSAISFIEAPSNWILGAAVLLVSTALLFCIVFSFYFEINVSIKSIGETDTTTGVKGAVSEMFGQVYYLPFKEGDLVKKDQVIGWLRMPGVDEKKLADLKFKIGSSVSELMQGRGVINSFSTQYAFIIETNIKNLLVDLDRKTATHLNLAGTHKASIAKQIQPFKIRLKILDSQISYIIKSKLQSELKMQKYALEDEKGKVLQQITALERELESTLSDSQASVQQSAQQAINQIDNYIHMHQIKSPTEGQIGKILLNQGAFIKAQEQLAIVIPDNSPIVARIQISTQDFSKVKVGSEVRLNIDSFPAYKYGYFKGKVLSIQNINSVLKEGGSSFYEAVVSIDTDVLDRRPAFVESTREVVKLWPGMKIEAHIITKTATLASLAADKIFGKD